MSTKKQRRDMTWRMISDCMDQAAQCGLVGSYSQAYLWRPTTQGENQTFHIRLITGKVNLNQTATLQQCWGGWGGQTLRTIDQWQPPQTSQAMMLQPQTAVLPLLWLISVVHVGMTCCPPVHFCGSTKADREATFYICASHHVIYGTWHG